MCRYTSSAKSVRSFGENFSLFWGRDGKKTHGQEGMFSMFPWRFLHVVNRGIKSGMMRSSTWLRDFVLAAFLQDCLLLENRTQRGISELRSACVLILSKSRIYSELGTFSAKWLEATQQQGVLRTCVAFALRFVFACSYWTFG